MKTKCDDKDEKNDQDNSEDESGGDDEGGGRRRKRSDQGRGRSYKNELGAADVNVGHTSGREGGEEVANSGVGHRDGEIGAHGGVGHGGGEEGAHGGVGHGGEVGRSTRRSGVRRRL